MLNATHSYLQLLQYIRSPVRYVNAFTPHWMEWNCLIYKDRYSTSSCHVLIVTHVVKETWPHSPCYALYSVSTLTISSHSLKSHHSPLHPVCQQTSQRTDNSLPASECLLLLLFRILLLLLLLPRRAYQRLQCRRTERKMGPPIRTQPCASCHRASFVNRRLVVCR